MTPLESVGFVVGGLLLLLVPAAIQIFGPILLGKFRSRNWGAAAEMGMGRLKFPFMAGAGAVIALSLILAPRTFPRWNEESQIIGGLIVGILGVVVLYAVMRALSNPK
jgi:hypothetical protein